MDFAVKAPLFHERRKKGRVLILFEIRYSKYVLTDLARNDIQLLRSGYVQNY